MEDSNPDAILVALIEKLNERKVGHIQMNEGPMIGLANDIKLAENQFGDRFKSSFKGTWISNYGHTKDTGNEYIQKGTADLISYGWPYVANSDIVEKFTTGAPLNSAMNADMKYLFQYAYGKGP